MAIVPPIKVDVDTENSCNHWLCCFGCKCCFDKVVTPPSVSIIREHHLSPTEEKTVESFRSHHHRIAKPQPSYVRPPSPFPLHRSPEFDPIAGTSSPVKEIKGVANA